MDYKCYVTLNINFYFYILIIIKFYLPHPLETNIFLLY
jgi:hypothetical protein